MEDGIGAGWAICHKDTIMAEESTYLGNETSFFQAEVIAIDRGLRWINNNCTDGMNISIRSDSQSTIQAILSCSTRSKLVSDCKAVLKKAKENHRIAIEWIKGHANHTGNELADFLARQGSCKKCDSVTPEVPVPMSNIKLKIKLHFETK